MKFEWKLGDKTLVQVDHSSITPESTNLGVMTMYRFLTYLERVKRIVEYKVSYTDCARDSSNSGDGFSICIKTPHKYKILPGASEKTSSKSFLESPWMNLRRALPSAKCSDSDMSV